MSNTSSRFEHAYELARSEYASLGVDTDAAIAKLARIQEKVSPRL